MPLERGRRSSILKPSKVRNPLGELDQLRPNDRNEDDGHTVTEITRNRRVSFSHKKGVALFSSEDNTMYYNAYEEHNKQDFSDSGGGSRLHISMDETEVKQEPHNNTQFVIKTEHNDDDDEKDHCVDIQAMLGIKKPPVRENQNLVLEVSHPSISDQTDLLINYKIEEGVSLTDKVKTEEIHDKSAEAGDILFNESQAEMSITQDVPVLIVTNEVKVSKVKKSTYNVFMHQDKENIKVEECMEQLYDQPNVKEEICIKNESVHIEDYYFPGSKRSLPDTCPELIQKKIKPEEDDLNISTGVLGDNQIQVKEECQVYCFTKEVKMSNKRETLGYEIKKTNISIMTPDDDVDPFADIKTNGLSTKYSPDESMENVADTSCTSEKRFEFVQCDNVDSSMKEDNLNTSDVLNINNVNSERRTIVFDNDKCNMSMTMALPANILDKQTCNEEKNIENKTVFYQQDESMCNMSMTTALPRDDKNEFNLGTKSNNRKTICFDPNKSDCDMSMTNVFALKSNKGTAPTQIDTELSTDVENNDNNPIAVNDVCTDVTMKTVCYDNVSSKPNRKTILFNQNDEDCNMSMTSIVQNVISSAVVQQLVGQKHEDKENVRRKTILFNQNTPDCDMSMTNVIPVKDLGDDVLKNDKRKTIYFDQNKPDCNMSITTNVISFQQNDKIDDNKLESDNVLSTQILVSSGVDCNKDTKDKRKTILFDENMPEFNMSMTNVIPNRGDIQNDKRKTINFDDLNMSMTNIIPTQDYRNEKRKTIHFDENMPDFNMSMTNIISVYRSETNEDKTDKRKTIHFDENMPDFNMSMTNVIPTVYKHETNEDKTDKRKTINFDENMPDFNMSMTNVIPTQTTETNEDKTDKRKTIHFDENMPDFNMSMTNVIPTQTTETNEDKTDKRKTIHFDENMPDFNMSMTNVIPPVYNSETIEHKTDKRKTIHFDENMPDFNMSMTSVIPTQKTGTNEDKTDKRKTIHFDENMPDFNMSMTNVIPPVYNSETNEDKTDKRKTIHFDENMPDFNMSMTSVIPTQKTGTNEDKTDKRKTIHFDENMPDFNMSMTNVIPPVYNSETNEDKTDKRKTIHFDENMPDFNMPMTSVIPTQKTGTNDDKTDKRKTIHFDENMPDFNMSMTNVIPPVYNTESIEDKTDKRKTIHFDENISDFNMSMTSVIPTRNTETNENKTDKRKTIHFDENMPDFNMSITNVIPTQKSETIEHKTDKRKTIHFDENMPDFNMPMTSVIPTEQIKSIEDEIDKRKTNINFDDNNKSTTNVIPIEEYKNEKRKSIHFDENMPDFNMSITISTQKTETCENKIDKRKTIHFDDSVGDFKMSITDVIPTQKTDINKSKTMDTDVNNPEFINEMQSKNTETNEIKSGFRNIRNANIPDFNMSMANVIQCQENIETNVNETDKRKTIHGNENNNMSMSEIIPIQDHKCLIDKRKSINFDKTIEDFDMTMTGVRKSIYMDQSLINLDISITGIVPLHSLYNKTTEENNENNVKCIEISTGNSKSVDDKEITSSNIEQKVEENIARVSEDISILPKQVELEKINLSVYDHSKANVQNNTVNDEELDSSDKYFEQGCKGLLNNTKLPDLSCLSMSSIMPRIPPTTHYDLTMNSVTSYVPRIDESKSMLIDKSIHENNLMEISKCFQSYRDPCRSENNSFCMPDKSINMSLPNIDDSCLIENNKSFDNTPKMQNEKNNGNNTPSTINSLIDNFGEKSMFVDKNTIDTQMQESKMEIHIENKSVMNITLPNISNIGEKSMINRSLIQKCDDDFHMSVDDVNIQVCSPISNDTNAEQPKLDIEIKNTEILMDCIEKCDKETVELQVNVKDSNVSCKIDLNKFDCPGMDIGCTLEEKQDEIILSTESCSKTKSNQVLLDVVKENSIGVELKLNNRTQNNCQENNISVNKVNFIDKIMTSESKGDDSIKKGSEKRKSDSTTCPETLSYVQPKKQKIIVPDVCLWVKDISVNKNISVSFNESKVETVKDVFKSNESKVQIVDDVSKSNDIKVQVADMPKSNDIKVQVADVPKSNDIKVQVADMPKSNDIKVQVADVPKSNDIKVQVADVPKSNDIKVQVADVPKSNDIKVQVADVPKSNDIKVQVADVPKSNDIKVQVADVPKSNDIKVQVADVPKSNECKAIVEDIFKSKEIDSHTYTISREQLEHFAKMKELNDNVHDQLNGSDHFIENVNMSLVDSSLDKSNECGKCNKYKKDNEDCEDCGNVRDLDRIVEEEELSSREKGSVCESLGTSTESTNSPLRLPNRSCAVETLEKPVPQPPKIKIKNLIEDCVADLAMCEVMFESKEIVFLLMKRNIKLRIILGTNSLEEYDSMTAVADILLEQKSFSTSNISSMVQSIASRMVLCELDVRSLRSMCVMAGDIPKMVARCYDTVLEAWGWLTQCYPLFIKYNLTLVDDRKWTFEIYDATHLCAWDCEIRLHNKRILHHTKPDNVRVRTSIGKSNISGAAIAQLVQSVEPGWSYIPHLISSLHELIRSSRKIVPQ